MTRHSTKGSRARLEEVAHLFKRFVYVYDHSDKVSAGFEMSKKKILYNTRVELSYLQAGLYYGNTYLDINGKQIRDMGVTASIGVNSVKSPLNYDIIFQYGIKGTEQNALIREDYAQVTFLLNFGAIWFTKGRKFD